MIFWTMLLLIWIAILLFTLHSYVCNHQNKSESAIFCTRTYRKKRTVVKVVDCDSIFKRYL